MYKQRGFALLDVFLAIIVFSIVTVGVYEMLGSYREKSMVQTVETDVMNIAQSYTPMLNQTAIQVGAPIIDANHKLSTNFLRAVPIPLQRIATSSDDYSYVATNILLKGGLFIGGNRAVIGFANVQTNGGDGSPILHYFVAGFKVNYSQAAQLIQDTNSSFGIFLGAETDSLLNAKSVTTLPQCPTKDCIYNIYLVSPKIDNANGFNVNDDFKAPAGIK